MNEPECKRFEDGGRIGKYCDDAGVSENKSRHMAHETQAHVKLSHPAFVRIAVFHRIDGHKFRKCFEAHSLITWFVTHKAMPRDKVRGCQSRSCADARIMLSMNGVCSIL